MPVEATWLDEHAEKAIRTLKSLPEGKPVDRDVVRDLLDSDFEVGMTVVRLFLDLPKDEFLPRLREQFSGPGGAGVLRFRNETAAFLDALESLGLLERMRSVIGQPSHWSDVLVERLKGGRGSAIKGQQRGRNLEDFVEGILEKVFQPEQIKPRCRFTGAKGLSTEKADFAIPTAEDPSILIEAKAYGATGSKQTDVLGDISRIVDQKRNDTTFLLVTDGVTWKERTSDLRKLIALQNEGQIQKIYTKAMAGELETDLRSLRKALCL